MSEGTGAKFAIQITSGFLILAGLVSSIVGWDAGSSCCGLGICGLVMTALVSSTAVSTSGDQGKMVLKQDSTGQWKWTANDPSNVQQSVQGRAAQYNDQSNQIMSRVIKEVRDGKPLEQLDDSELDAVAGAYGVNSGSKAQKIEALHNSELATKGLQLGAAAAAGGVGALGAAAIINKGRQNAKERAEELHAQGREKLQENIDKGRH